MPQMAPLNWLLMFLFTVMMIFTMNSLIYFSFLYKPKTFFKSHFKKINWKW